jgi:hypothetical protein
VRDPSSLTPARREQLKSFHCGLHCENECAYFTYFPISRGCSLSSYQPPLKPAKRRKFARPHIFVTVASACASGQTSLQSFLCTNLDSYVRPERNRRAPVSLTKQHETQRVAAFKGGAWRRMKMLRQRARGE